MKIINIRFYLPDFLKVYEDIKEPLDIIYKNSAQPIKIFFWYNSEVEDINLELLKDFIIKWEDKQHFKTIIRTKFEDNALDFIWFDIRPESVNPVPRYVRFSYPYFNSGKIIKGLEYLKEIMAFTTRSTMIRKQKRTDIEG
tara:strand:- start:76 stop:498 length:423 start_codon:yes stop_codon:yes gene_type:complete